MLGFSDHTPWSYASDFVSPIRMPLDALPDYVRSVRSLQRRYAGRIELRLGLECEYFEDYMPWLRDTIREYRLDYVIFGNHFYRTDERYPYFGSDTRSAEMLDLYAESAIRGMETGLYAYLAHPDLFMRSYGRFDGHCARISREICRRASRLPYAARVQRFDDRLQRGARRSRSSATGFLADCGRRGMHGDRRHRCPRPPCARKRSLLRPGRSGARGARAFR